MARKLPDKIEDWTAPWEAPGTELDPDVVKKLVFDLMHAEQKLKGEKSALGVQLTEAKTELTAAQARLAAKPQDEAAKDQEISTLRTKVATLEAEGRPEDQKKIMRLSVANDNGLTAKDAERLVGETLEELEGDAAEFAERLGVGKGDGDDSGEQNPPQGPTSQRPIPRQDLGNGRNRNGTNPALLSAEDILAGKAPSLDSADGLRLAPLSR